MERWELYVCGLGSHPKTHRKREITVSGCYACSKRELRGMSTDASRPLLRICKKSILTSNGSAIADTCTATEYKMAQSNRSQIAVKHLYAVRASTKRYKRVRIRLLFLHTYLDGTSSFKYPGLWAVGIPHSMATLSTQGVPVVCMGFGSCTVAIFSCPALATLAGQASLFFLLPLTLTLVVYIS